MRKRSLWRFSLVVLGGVLFAGVFASSHHAFAQTSTSPSYQMTESQFGTNSSLESCSEKYCAKVTIGDSGQGSSATSAEFGEVQYNEPLIEMIVETGQSSLGDLSTEKTGTKTMKVKIRNYLSGGYMLQIVGEPPKYQGHTLATSSTGLEPMPGTEQFAINAVANTIPESIGENPKAQPSGDDALTLIRPGYNTPNVYRYINGDTVAQSQENTGGADITITMIVNISSATPAGIYSGDFSAIVLPYY